MLKREEVLQTIQKDNNFDVVIIGGGSVGVGSALDCASRGYKTLLLESFDFAKGTSSRSTKLLHGGVRYLEQFHFHLVMDSLRERGLLLKNAPHLASWCEFIIPCYSYVDLAFYRAGLFLYDTLAKFPKGHCSYTISKASLIEKYPNVKKDGLVGGIVYWDATFDDARLALELSNSAIEEGAFCLNYAKVVAFNKDSDGKINQVEFTDTQTNQTYKINTKCVINATGIFSDSVRLLDDKNVAKIVQPSQGVHLMFHKDLFNTQQSLLVPKTSDGRVLFSVPWHDFIIVGTTDTPVENPSIEPKAQQVEVDFIIDNLNAYLEKKIKKEDIMAVYAGIRPLIKQNKSSTSSISREEHIEISSSNLISLVGGKWTSYRRICEKLVDNIISQTNLLQNAKSKTTEIKIHNYLSKAEQYSIPSEFRFYGSAYKILQSYEEDFDRLLSSKYVYNYAQVRYAIEYEQALSLDDVLARRIRLLFLDPQVCILIAKEVAIYMAKLLKKDVSWIDNQVEEFTKIAQNYVKTSYLK